MSAKKTEERALRHERLWTVVVIGATVALVLLTYVLWKYGAVSETLAEQSVLGEGHKKRGHADVAPFPDGVRAREVIFTALNDGRVIEASYERNHSSEATLRLFEKGGACTTTPLAFDFVVSDMAFIHQGDELGLVVIGQKKSNGSSGSVSVVSFVRTELSKGRVVVLANPQELHEGIDRPDRVAVANNGRLVVLIADQDELWSMPVEWGTKPMSGEHFMALSVQDASQYPSALRDIQNIEVLDRPGGELIRVYSGEIETFDLETGELLTKSTEPRRDDP